MGVEGTETAPTAPSASRSTPTGPPAPSLLPPLRPTRTRRTWAAIAVIVVAIIVLGFLAFTFLLGFGSTGAGGPVSVTYLNAAAASDPLAGSTAGGNWSLVVAAGVELSEAAVASTSATVGGGCTYASPGGGPPPPTVYVPNYAGSFESGKSPWWAMAYYRSATQQVLLVEVVNGTANALLVASGNCTASFASLTAIPSSGLADSPASASAVWNGGGSAFVAAHANLTYNAEFALLGGGSACLNSLGVCWGYLYTPCNPLVPSSSSLSYPVFEALVNPVNGGLFTRATSMNCSASSLPGLGGLP